MVKSGYILPDANYAARMSALEQGLKNNQVKVLAMQDRLEAPKVIVPTVVPPTIVDRYNEQLKNANTSMGPVNIAQAVGATPNSVSTTPKAITPQLDFAAAKLADVAKPMNYISALKQKLATGDKGLRKTSGPKERPTYSVNSSPIINEFEEAKKQLTPNANDTESDIATYDSSNGPVESKTSVIIANLRNATTKDKLGELIRTYGRFRLGSSQGGRGNTSKFFAYPVSDGKLKAYMSADTADNLINETWAFKESNPDGWYSTLGQNIDREQQYGKGIGGGRLFEESYQKNAPNFGNLYLNEKMLKKGILSISVPFSKRYVIHVKTVSPLLKKMVHDIANTLEFDTKDYYNLNPDEKRVIEKIIRHQKEMKDVNIQKLIDDDDYKMKKRLQILVGEINAGNSSYLIKQEMKTILKNLLDNNAIGYMKYRNSIKALEALG